MYQRNSNSDDRKYAETEKCQIQILRCSSSYFKRTLPDVELRIGDDVINPSKDIRNLGIMFDDVMSMSTQVTNLSRSIIYYLRNVTRIRRFMDADTCSNVVRSLVLSRLDYGNALLL